ncbi:MAG: patatin-like phospholipase family protein [Tannerella sp.]|jgi:NTE family protein|nr:patatin-like phospholipase family protein [Tannerella sp.]
MSKQRDKKYKLGLVLSGGGSKGFAHIGILKLLEECGLRPDIIVGTSAGALIGTLYADGYKPEEIISLFAGREFSEFTSMQIPKMGIFDSSKFNKYFKKVIHSKNFEDLEIPVIVMATDLDHGKAHAFSKGPISEAITASCSMPILFNPVIINGIHYVDGGIFHNFPVSIIRNECEAIIGSDVGSMIPDKYNKTIIGIAERSYHYLFKANTEKERELCDILIEANELGRYKTFDLKNIDMIVRIGYEAAEYAFEEFLKNKPIATLIKNYSSKTSK